MRQVGLGLIQYVNAHNVFPNSGTFEENPTALASGDPKDSNIYKALSNPAGFGPAVRCIAGSSTSSPTSMPQDLYNAFDRTKPYFDNTIGPDATRPTNLKITSTSIGILTCPEDPTISHRRGQPVVRRQRRLHPLARRADRLAGPRGRLVGESARPSTGGPPRPADRRDVPGDQQGQAPWDVRTSANSITDGASTTILLTENIRAGAAPGGVAGLTGTVPTNWACPHPNFVAFLASDNVCNGGGTGLAGTGSCGTSSPGTQGGKTFGPHWANANRPGTHENINAGLKVTEEGGSPYPSSHHPGGVNVVMCDGSARFVAEDIDGEVWAKLVTPQGSTLPGPFGQSPLNPDDLAE